MVDLVRPGQPVGERGKKGAQLVRWCGDEGEPKSPRQQVVSNPRPTPFEHARGPHPRSHRVLSRVRCRYVVPQASMSPGDEGCARGTWGLVDMVGILDAFVSSCARASASFCAVEVAGGSEGVASVQPDSATIAGRARVGPGNRVCMVCGPSREVVGRCIRLDTDMN